ncbi:MAG: response regulator [Candidatus Margulisiibacteriota bacterium]
MAKTVLVVDDEPSVVEVVKDLLRNAGYNVIFAFNSEQALANAVKEKPDLAVLDVMMPGMNGFELGYKLKTNSATQGMPIVYLTILKEQKDRDEAKKIGAEDFISKPFDPKALLETIEKIIGK